MGNAIESRLNRELLKLITTLRITKARVTLGENVFDIPDLESLSSKSSPHHETYPSAKALAWTEVRGKRCRTFKVPVWIQAHHSDPSSVRADRRDVPPKRWEAGGIQKTRVLVKNACNAETC